MYMMRHVVDLIRVLIYLAKQRPLELGVIREQLVPSEYHPNAAVGDIAQDASNNLK